MLHLIPMALDAALFTIIFGIFTHPHRMAGGFLGLDWGDFTLLLWLAYHVFLWTWKGTTIGGIIIVKVPRGMSDSAEQPPTVFLSAF